MEKELNNEETVEQFNEKDLIEIEKMLDLLKELQISEDDFDSLFTDEEIKEN